MMAEKGGSETASQSSFAKDELFFTEEPPKQVEIECPICYHVMLNEPHLVTCCGHHFCGPCTRQVKGGPCPFCKEQEYQVVIDKNWRRIINGLKVQCTNRDKNCQWRGELKDLCTHLNRDKREGECQYEEVTCIHNCGVKDQRHQLVDHEKTECPSRSYNCQYCSMEATYKYITEQHYCICPSYPVHCPNQCQEDKIPRSDLDTHIQNACPLRSVDCEFKWAGCMMKLKLTDLDKHLSDDHVRHTSLLAKAVRDLQRENEELKKENEVIKKVSEAIRQENKVLKIERRRENDVIKKELNKKIDRIHHAMWEDDEIPILPVTLVPGKKAHFYSDFYGYKMSISYSGHPNNQFQIVVYAGKFDADLEWPFQHNIILKIGESDTRYLTHTQESYLRYDTALLCKNYTKNTEEKHCFLATFNSRWDETATIKVVGLQKHQEFMI